MFELCCIIPYPENYRLRDDTGFTNQMGHRLEFLQFIYPKYKPTKYVHAYRDYEELLEFLHSLSLAVGRDNRLTEFTISKKSFIIGSHLHLTVLHNEAIMLRSNIYKRTFGENVVSVFTDINDLKKRLLGELRVHLK